MPAKTDSVDAGHRRARREPFAICCPPLPRVALSDGKLSRVKGALINAEGWYVDPFGLHGARWFSDGTPTALVRDGQTESNDEPPSKTFDGELSQIVGATAVDGEDLRRADGDEPPFDPAEGARAAFDIMDQIGPNVFWHPKPHRRGRS
jgi:hypothetical protein